MESKRETDDWFVQLRSRFLDLTRRRVPEEAVEDLVQEALRIVIEKGLDDGPDRQPEDMPDLAWCFAVLRNTVGNYYQKRRVRSGHAELESAIDLPEEGPTPLESLESRELHRVLHESIRGMGSDDERCARYLRRLAEGRSPAEVAEEERLQAAVLYRRLYRCRGKLRAILLHKGVLV